MKLFAIWDVKIGEYAPPFVAKTREEAKRMIVEAMKGDGSLLGRHPADFALFEFASWEPSEIGAPVEPLAASRVCSVSDLVEGGK